MHIKGSVVNDCLFNKDRADYEIPLSPLEKYFFFFLSCERKASEVSSRRVIRFPFKCLFCQELYARLP